MQLGNDWALRSVITLAYLMPASVLYAGDVWFLFATVVILFFSGLRVHLSPVLALLSLLLIYVFCYHIFINAQLHDFIFFNAGSSQSLKTALYGIFNLVVSIVVFNSSKNASFSDFVSVCYAVFYSGIALSFVNLGVWIFEAGAVFSRYNYLPPIAGSHGVTLTLLVISLLSSFAIKENRSSPRTFIIVGQVVILFCMATILVREVWALFLLSVITSSIRRQSHRLTGARVLSLSVLLFGVVAFAFFLSGTALMADILGEASSAEGSSTTVRVLMVERAFELILEHPWFGVGYGSYPLFVDFVVMSSGGTGESVSSPHNGAILLLAELGIFGLFLWGFACWHLSFALWTAHAGGPTNSLPLRIFFVLLLADQLISNSLFIPPATERNVFPVTVVIWIMVGFLVRRLDESARRPVVVS